MADPEIDNPEQHARRANDAGLAATGWRVQDRGDLNGAAAAGVAVRELPARARRLADVVVVAVHGPGDQGAGERAGRRVAGTRFGEAS